MYAGQRALLQAHLELGRQIELYGGGDADAPRDEAIMRSISCCSTCNIGI